MDRAQRRERGTGAQWEQRLDTVLWRPCEKNGSMREVSEVSSSGQGFHRNLHSLRMRMLLLDVGWHGGRPFLRWNARRWYVFWMFFHLFLMSPWLRIHEYWYLVPRFLVANPATLLWVQGLDWDSLMIGCTFATRVFYAADMQGIRATIDHWNSSFNNRRER